MKNIYLAFYSLFKKGRNNPIKILSLSVGLALSFVLIAKVHFEQTFDNFYPDAERIYQIQTVMQRDDMKDTESRGQVSGAVAVGMAEDISEVEAATRFTYIDGDIFYDDDRRTYSGKFILADNNLFNLLPRPVLAGDAKEILSRPMYAMISNHIAKMMGGEVVGRTITLDNHPGKEITIGGVFKETPDNTHYKYDVVVSLSSIRNFMQDGSMGWLGNDRYFGYVRLAEGTDYKSLDKAITEMQERHQPMERFREAGIMMTYRLDPLLSLHKDDDNTKRMSVLLSLLAFALLFTAVMNYILISISALVNRAKEVAVYKCYGASGSNIMSVILAETSVHLFISIIIAILLILGFQGAVKDLTGTSVNALLSPTSALLLAGVCLLTYLVAGVIPSQLFTRIPVAAAFRNYKESRRIWKLALLFIQFIGCAFLVSLLAIIGKQYQLMVNDDPGYNYDNVLYCNLTGIGVEKRQQVIDELNRIPDINMVATASRLPFQGLPGNNVMISEEVAFNFGDMQMVNTNYLPLMGISIIEGTGFSANSAENDIVVSRAFAERVSLLAGWNNIIGRDINLTQWEYRKVVGIYDDIRIGSIANNEERPTVMLYSKSPGDIIMIRTHELSRKLIEEIETTLSNSMPDKYIEVTSYQDKMFSLYNDSRKFRDSVMIGGIITLLISLIGLIGYTTDETNRRRAEIAVRKINGAAMKDILNLFIKEVLRIALPAVIIGAIAAYFAAVKWQEQFAEKAGLSIIIFIGCTAAIIAIIVSIVSVNSYRISNQNPADSLKAE